MANDIQKSMRMAKATYDFTVVGGATGTIILPSADMIPLGAIIQDVIIDATVAFTSAAGNTGIISFTGGGLTIVGGTPIITSAAPFTGATVGRVGVAGVITTGYPVQKATSTAPIKIVIATQAVTAGQATIYVY